MARAVSKMSIEVNFKDFVPVSVVDQIKETIKALMESQNIRVDIATDFDYEVRSNQTYGELNALNGLKPD